MNKHILFTLTLILAYANIVNAANQTNNSYIKNASYYIPIFLYKKDDTMYNQPTNTLFHQVEDSKPYNYYDHKGKMLACLDVPNGKKPDDFLDPQAPLSEIITCVIYKSEKLILFKNNRNVTVKSFNYEHTQNNDSKREYKYITKSS